MPSARVIEAVNVLKDGDFCLAAAFPCPAPDQFGLDGFEERLDNGIDKSVKVRDGHASMKSHLACCRGNLMVDKSTQ
jgi:hypothetical protein